MDLEGDKTVQEIIAYLQTLISQGVERAEKKIPDFPTASDPGELAELYHVFSEFIDMLHASYTFQKRIAAGDLTAEVDKMNFLAMPLRGLQSSLKHLTWQASQVANGNLKQTVHFLGEFADSFNAMIAALQEKELMQTRLLQAQKMESVGQLAAGIAHEINTPAQFVGTNIDFMAESFQDIDGFVKQILELQENVPKDISTAIDTALDGADWEYLSEELPQAIKQSRDGIERISAIVQAMKNFSHPGSKEKAAQALNPIIETTITVAGSEWKYVADIELDLDPDLPNVPLFADEMGQVILNILVNAAHAIAAQLDKTSGNEKGIISISSRQIGSNVELRIQDTGPGIPEAEQLRIFDPFYTTKEVGKGTGQGLTICHDVIVGKHQGTISVESVIDKGTSFIITLPLHE